MDLFPHGQFAWYHRMTFSGYAAIVGSLPSLSVPAAPGLAHPRQRGLRGRSQLRHRRRSLRHHRDLRELSGRLTTTFAGWGTRIARLETSDGVFRATR
jgi:hypothetical protein